MPLPSAIVAALGTSGAFQMVLVLCRGAEARDRGPLNKGRPRQLEKRGPHEG